MKKILSIFFLLSLTFAAVSTAHAQGGDPPIPDPPVDSAVLDALDWLTPTQEEEINNIVFALDTDGLAQFAVVTLNDCGEDSERYRYELFNEWGIGHADDNDGLLILVCWYDGVEGKRSLEQETGLGMEGILPDTVVDQVFVDYFVATFSQGKPDSEVVSSGEAGAALVAMVHAYDEIIRQEPQEPKATPVASPQEGLSGPAIILMVAFIIIAILGLGVLLGWWGNSTGSVSSGSDESPYIPSTWVGGSLPSRSSRRREDDSNDSDGMNFPRGGFSSPSRPSFSSNPSRSSFNWGGGRSMGGGRSGKF